MGRAGLKQVIIQTGDVLRVDLVKRGALLGFSEQEWQRRASLEQSKELKFLPYVGMAFIALGVIDIVASVFWFGVFDTGDLVLPIGWFIVGGLYVSIYYIRTTKNLNPGAIPGLYENGIQLPNHFFIPYPEIGQIERKEGRMNGFRKRDIIRLRSKFAKKPGSITDGWVVSAEFLGTWGMAALKERLEITRGLRTTGRPTLVLYGPGGARFQERGMEPIRGAW